MVAGANSSTTLTAPLLQRPCLWMKGSMDEKIKGYGFSTEMPLDGVVAELSHKVAPKQVEASPLTIVGGVLHPPPNQ